MGIKKQTITCTMACSYACKSSGWSGGGGGTKSIAVRWSLVVYLMSYNSLPSSTVVFSGKSQSLGVLEHPAAAH